MNLRERALLVDALGSALVESEISLKQIPELLRKVLEEGAWREFETQLGKHVSYDNFEAFVATPPLSGLGTSIDFIRRIMADDQVALALLDQTLQHSEGNHTGTNQCNSGNGLNQPISTTTPESDISETSLIPNQSDKKRERSNRILHRLQEDFPELHQQVVGKKKTLHAAAVEAKIYPARIAVNLDSPQSAATSLITNASPEFLEELRRLLNEHR